MAAGHAPHAEPSRCGPPSAAFDVPESPPPQTPPPPRQAGTIVLHLGLFAFAVPLYVIPKLKECRTFSFTAAPAAVGPAAEPDAGDAAEPAAAAVPDPWTCTVRSASPELEFEADGPDTAAVAGALAEDGYFTHPRPPAVAACDPAADLLSGEAGRAAVAAMQATLATLLPVAAMPNVRWYVCVPCFLRFRIPPNPLLGTSPSPPTRRPASGRRGWITATPAAPPTASPSSPGWGAPPRSCWSGPAPTGRTGS
jgi:hypothetical protein